MTPETLCDPGGSDPGGADPEWRAHRSARYDPRLRPARHLHHEHAGLQHLLVPGVRRGPVAALVGPRHGNCPRRHLLRQVQQHVQHAVRRRLHDPARTPAGARAATRDADLPAAAVLAVRVRRRACLRLLGRRRPAHVCGAWIAIAGAAPAAGSGNRGPDRRVPAVSDDRRHDTDRDRERRKTSRPSSPSPSRPSPRTTPRSVTAIFWTPPGAAPKR